MKGQMSIDVILALVAAIVFFSLMVAFNNGLAEDTAGVSISNSMDSILLDAYSVVGSVKAQGIEIEYTSPALNAADSEGAPLDCTITIGADFIRVSSSGAGKTSEYTGIQTGYFSNFSFNCGETIIIDEAGAAVVP